MIERAPDLDLRAALLRLTNLLPNVVTGGANIEPFAIFPLEILAELIARGKIDDGAGPTLDRFSILFCCCCFLGCRR
jgi:hypothetical protein